MKVMIDRDQIVCSAIPGLTDWAKKVEGSFGQIDLYVDNKGDFKLGEVVNVVAFFHPEQNKLYYVRRATEEEIEKESLNPLTSMIKSEVDC